MLDCISGPTLLHEPSHWLPPVINLIATPSILAGTLDTRTRRPSAAASVGSIVELRTI